MYASECVWDAISAALQWLWHNIFEPVWNGIRGAVNAVAGCSPAHPRADIAPRLRAVIADQQAGSVPEHLELD